MCFFITSEGLGKVADLGGLKGADAHCQALAKAAGAGGQWRAYLSTNAENARDRMFRRELLMRVAVAGEGLAGRFDFVLDMR